MYDGVQTPTANKPKIVLLVALPRASLPATGKQRYRTPHPAAVLRSLTPQESINMKYLLFLSLLAAASSPAPLLAAAVGVSIRIGQPGFYGRIDLGDMQRPRLLYAQPRYAYRSAATREPIYLHVPPSHARNWGNNCRRYNACHERVYFVQNTWYEREYVPRYQQQHRDYLGGARGDDYNQRDNDRHGDGQKDSHRGNDVRGDTRDDGHHDNGRGRGH